jgi:copper(I)-binding protein
MGPTLGSSGYHKRNFNEANMRLIFGILLACAGISAASAAGRLRVEQAWIRSAPPGAMMLAGYATLRNEGDAPLAIVGADSKDFAEVSLHLSHEADGLVRMEPIKRMEIQAGSYQVLAPGSYHLMLMRPVRELKAGDSVQIHISTEPGTGVDADFIVGDSAPASIQ